MFCSSREPWPAQLPYETDQKLLHNVDVDTIETEAGEFTGTRRVTFQRLLLTYSYYLKSQLPPLVYERPSGALQQMREQFDSAFTTCAILS